MGAARVLVLVSLCLAQPAAADSSDRSGNPGSRRVAFATLPGTDEDAATRIDRAREHLAAVGYHPVPPGALRDALEGPLESGESGRGPLARAREHLAAAREAFSSFEYDRALGELDDVDKLLAHREPSEPIVEILVDRHILAGLVRQGSGRQEQAIAAFRLAHFLDPDRAPLDPAQYRPDVVALQRQALRRGARGALRVVIDPVGAEVWVDGKQAGPAPYHSDQLAEGPHWIVATKSGHETRGDVVDVGAGRRQAVRIELPSRSAAERAEEIRRSLAGATGADELRAGAAELATAAGAAVVILVRSRGDRVQGAVYQADSGELGAWAPLPSSRLFAQLENAPDGAGGSPGGGLVGGVSGGEPARPWYLRPWGIGLLIGGGAVLTGTIVVLALSAGGSDEPSYEIGDWCWEQACR